LVAGVSPRKSLWGKNFHRPRTPAGMRKPVTSNLFRGKGSNEYSVETRRRKGGVSAGQTGRAKAKERKRKAITILGGGKFRLKEGGNSWPKKPL